MKSLILTFVWLAVSLIVGFCFMWWVKVTPFIFTFRYCAIWVGFLALVWMTTSRSHFHFRQSAKENEKSK